MRHAAWLLVLWFGQLLSLTQLSLAQAHLPTAHSKELVKTSQTRADPCYRKLASTERLLAHGITIQPHGSTFLTPHPNDYLVIALSPLELDAIGQSGNSYQLRLNEEEMQVMKGGWPHRLTNVSDKTARLLEIEVQNNIAPERALCGLAASPCSDGRFGKTEEGTYSNSTLFETPKVKLTKVELGPGGILAKHGHSGSRLLIALTTIHLTDGTGN